MGTDRDPDAVLLNVKGKNLARRLQEFQEMGSPGHAITANQSTDDHALIVSRNPRRLQEGCTVEAVEGIGPDHRTVSPDHGMGLQPVELKQESIAAGFILVT